MSRDGDDVPAGVFYRREDGRIGGHLNCDAVAGCGGVLVHDLQHLHEVGVDGGSFGAGRPALSVHCVFECADDRVSFWPEGVAKVFCCHRLAECVDHVVRYFEIHVGDPGWDCVCADYSLFDAKSVPEPSFVDLGERVGAHRARTRSPRLTAWMTSRICSV